MAVNSCSSWVMEGIEKLSNYLPYMERNKFLGPGIVDFC
jgi:hypothetical protein